MIEFIKGLVIGIVAIGVVALLGLPILLGALFNVGWLLLYLLIIPVLTGLWAWAIEYFW